MADAVRGSVMGASLVPSDRHTLGPPANEMWHESDPRVVVPYSKRSVLGPILVPIWGLFGLTFGLYSFLSTHIAYLLAYNSSITSVSEMVCAATVAMVTLLNTMNPMTYW